MSESGRALPAKDDRDMLSQLLRECMTKPRTRGSMSGRDDGAGRQQVGGRWADRSAVWSYQGGQAQVADRLCWLRHNSLLRKSSVHHFTSGDCPHAATPAGPGHVVQPDPAACPHPRCSSPACPRSRICQGSVLQRRSHRVGGIATACIGCDLSRRGSASTAETSPVAVSSVSGRRPGLSTCSTLTAYPLLSSSGLPGEPGRIS